MLDEAAKSAVDDIFDAIVFERFLRAMMVMVVDQGMSINMMSSRQLLNGSQDYEEVSPFRGLVLAIYPRIETRRFLVVRLNLCAAKTFFFPTAKKGFRD